MVVPLTEGVQRLRHGVIRAGLKQPAKNSISLMDLQFLGCHPLGLSAELVQGADLVAIKRGMDQQLEPASSEQDRARDCAPSNWASAA